MKDRPRFLIRRILKQQHEVRDFINTPKGRQYVAQIEEMVNQAKKWLVNNSGAKPIISFDVPKGVWLITDVAAAIANGYLRVDKEGQRMLDELGWTADTPRQPSFRMIQMAIEIATGA